MTAPTQLADFLRVVELSEGAFAVGHLFQKKFGCAPPDEPRHFVALYRDEENRLLPAAYAHFRPFGDICLVGGACTDGGAIRRMSDAERSLITASNSIYLFLLQRAFAIAGPDYEAFFGYCGDDRAEQVDLQAGFEKTAHRHLLAYWHKPLHPVIQAALLAKAAALGPF